jgi:hypothetical protein
MVTGVAVIGTYHCTASGGPRLDYGPPAPHYQIVAFGSSCSGRPASNAVSSGVYRRFGSIPLLLGLLVVVFGAHPLSCRQSAA